jgi:hypothetical protein
MRASRVVPRVAATLAGATILIPSGAGLALAASSLIPDGSGVIHACYGSTGVLRAVEAPEECRPPETALDWNATGPQGPQGPAGPTGATGPAGVSGVYVAFEGGINGVPGNRSGNTADCQTGDVAVGGGFDLGLTDSLQVTESHPDVESGAPTGWSVTVLNTDDDAIDPADYPEWDMWAVCAATPA